MYHLGKICFVYSPKSKSVVSCDSSVQVAIKMWDGNFVNGDIEASLADSIKVGDIVLVDYAPLPSTPAPKVTVTKILKGEEGRKAWKLFEEHFEEKKESRSSRMLAPGPQQHII